jgi:hypothetical protein
MEREDSRVFKEISYRGCLILLTKKNTGKTSSTALMASKCKKSNEDYLYDPSIKYHNYKVAN